MRSSEPKNTHYDPVAAVAQVIERRWGTPQRKGQALLFPVGTKHIYQGCCAWDAKTKMFSAQFMALGLRAPYRSPMLLERFAQMLDATYPEVFGSPTIGIQFGFTEECLHPCVIFCLAFGRMYSPEHIEGHLEDALEGLERARPAFEAFQGRRLLLSRQELLLCLEPISGRTN